MTKITRDIPNHEGETVADRLKAAREEAKLTRKAVAVGTGIPYSSVEKYERGDMDPNTVRLQVLCAFYDVSVEWVMYGDSANDSKKPGNHSSDNGAETQETVETLPSAALLVNSLETLAVDTPQKEVVVTQGTFDSNCLWRGFGLERLNRVISAADKIDLDKANNLVADALGDMSQNDLEELAQALSVFFETGFEIPFLDDEHEGPRIEAKGWLESHNKFTDRLRTELHPLVISAWKTGTELVALKPPEPGEKIDQEEDDYWLS